jgi:hypothetical protein
MADKLDYKALGEELGALVERHGMDVVLDCLWEFCIEKRVALEKGPDRNEGGAGVWRHLGELLATAQVYAERRRL